MSEKKDMWGDLIQQVVMVQLLGNIRLQGTLVERDTYDIRLHTASDRDIIIPKHAIVYIAKAR